MKNRHQRRTEQKQKPKPFTPEQLAAAINAQWQAMSEMAKRLCDLGDACRAQFGIPLPPAAQPTPPPAETP